MKTFIIFLAVAAVVGGGFWITTRDDVDIDLPEEDFVEEEMEEEEFMEILGQVEALDSVKYDVLMESPEQTMEGTMWQRGGKIRMEGEVEGQETVVIMDTEERVVLVYLPVENMAMEVSLGEVEEIQESSMKDQAMELPERNPVVIGRETVNGMDCIVVEYTTEGETTGKMWVWREHGLPVRFEVGDTVTEARNIDFGEIPNERFELPEGVEATEVPTEIPTEIPSDITDEIPEDLLDQIPEF